ncbi:MAG TPA: N,N-dimethylformamidase beta subunit family domain-containing protein, partial [Candidatus Dormibacteraeota bacterium]|nr:N,N-dimethylformamidase beta subunit family domain-containing protein [Candidatus Dormibacteraeota bacterium]
NRVVVHYRNANLDPIQGPTTSTQFRDPPVNRPEQVLVGVQWTNEVNWGNNAPYVVSNSASWVYAGTGLNDSDAVPGIVGYEMDRYMPGYPAPNATSWTLLSHSAFIDSSGNADYSNSSIYQAPSGAWVFATGTMSWSWGLDSFNNAGTRTGVPTDVRIQQATINILNTFLNGLSVVNDLKVTVPATTIAGQAFQVTVTAEDAQGNPVGSYNGTVHFASSDTATGVVLPPDSTLVNGQGSFSATLVRAGPQTLTVSDGANRLSTTVNLTVSAAPASRLLVASSKSTATAGSSFPVSVTAVDPYGNTDNNYAGTVHFTTSDPSPGSLPPDSTLINGQRGFSATLDTAGPQTVAGTDTARPSIAGAFAIQVAPAAASSISLAVPGTVKANQPFTVTVTMNDAFGNVATGYRGSIHFTSSDLVAQTAGTLPPDYTFVGADAGTHVFSVTLVTPPGETLTVTDKANPSLTTTSRSINVTLL